MTFPSAFVAMTGAIAVSGRFEPAGAFVEQPPSVASAKFVMASFRKKPSTVSHDPKLTLIVVVIAKAFPEASTIDT